MTQRRSTFRATKTPGVYVRHSDACPRAFHDSGPRCRCLPSYRGRRRNPITKKPEWGPITKDRNEVLPWLGALKRPGVVQALRERADAGRTLGSLIDEWLDGAEAGHIARRRRGKPVPYAPGTLPKYRSDLEHLIKPRFGDIPARFIDEHEWQRFFDELARGGLSFSRRANIKSPVSSIYAWAAHRSRGYVDANPLKDVDLGAHDGERRERAALGDEAERLLDALAPVDRVPYAIALYAGLRRGEIDHLQWTHVQFVDGKPGYWLTVVERPGKSHRRELPIGEALRSILLAEWMRQGRPRAGKVSLASVMSRRLAERALIAWGWRHAGWRLDARGRRGKVWEKARPDALEPIGLHECRRTYASWCVAAHYDLATIMEYMGHADLQTTQRYVSVLPREARPDESRRLDDYLARVHAHAT
jgi:integrase